MAQNLDTLKKFVAKNIEAGGFLNSLRAQLKVEVYKIIESQDQKSKDNVGFQWEHPLLNQIKGITEGMKSLELIVEYLEFFKLDYTAQVLRKEANMNDPVIRDTLARKLGLSQSMDSLRPLLMILISEFSKGGGAVNPSSPPKQAAPQPTKTSKYDTQATNLSKKKEEDDLKKKKEEDEKKKQLEEKAKQEEKLKKEAEEQKKQKERPQTAPVKPEPAAPIVNKIRGGPTKQNALSSMFGIDLGGGGGQKNQFEEDDIFSSKPKQPAKQQPVANNAKSKDPYSFDVAEQPGKKNQNPKAGKAAQPSADPYAYDLDDQFSQPKKYDYDLNQTIGKKFNNPYTVPEKGKPIKNKNDEIEEDIDDFQESRDDRAKQSNQLFTSDDDYQKATQSLGVDESVDSLALEEYDYYEDVFNKK